MLRVTAAPRTKAIATLPAFNLSPQKNYLDNCDTEKLLIKQFLLSSKEIWVFSDISESKEVTKFSYEIWSKA